MSASHYIGDSILFSLISLRPRLLKFSHNLTTHFEAIISPGSKLEFAVLIIEGEPCDVNLTRALEDPRWNVEHTSVSVCHNVGLERAIEPLVSTEKEQNTCICIFFNVHDHLLVWRKNE